MDPISNGWEWTGRHLVLCVSFQLCQESQSTALLVFQSHPKTKGAIIHIAVQAALGALWEWGREEGSKVLPSSLTPPRLWPSPDLVSCLRGHILGKDPWGVGQGQFCCAVPS